MPIYNDKKYDCPFDCFIDIIKGEWRTSILLALRDRPCYFMELVHGLKGISPKVLTENLQVMERNHIVQLKVYPTVPPKVEYSLTVQGKELIKVMDGINGYVSTWF